MEQVVPNKGPNVAVTYQEPEWEYCVRIFADHRVETRHGDVVSFRHGKNDNALNKNTLRGPELLSYLAARPDRSATLDEIRDHLWWGREISPRTAETLVSGTRSVLGGTAYLSHAEGEPGYRRYRLASTVVTDVDLLQHDLAYARSTAPDNPHHSADLLQQHLARIEGPAFGEGSMGSGLTDWAAANRVLDRVERSLIEAALLAADLYQAHGPDRLPNARWAIEQALKACPTNEALIRAAMHLDALNGHREAAHSRYVALAHELARDDLEPEPETTSLHRDIMRPGYQPE